MNALSLALTLLAVAAPIALFFVLLLRLRDALAPESREPRRLAMALTTAALGALLFLPAWLAEGWLQGWAGLDVHARSATDLTSLLYAFFVAAPLEQGLKVAGVAPVWRARKLRMRLDGVVYAASAALGFVSAHNAELLLSRGADALTVGRALLAVPAHLFFASMWGYALGREAQASSRRRGGPRLLGGRTFNLIWLTATIFNAIYDHLVFARSAIALIGAAPIILSMLIVGYIFGRDLLRSAASPPPSSLGRRRFLPSIAPPSLGAVRAALWRTERPVMLTWIGVGALVTTGVMTATLIGAVALGHRLGVDFASVDRGETGASSSLAPLALLGAAALAAFPIAGYLVARASSTRSVLEPAIAAGLAIAGSLVLLGLAAPVAVVFAMAFAPVAFGLACAGAWIGIAR